MRKAKPKSEKQSKNVAVRMNPRERKAVEKLRKEESRRLGRTAPMSAGEYFYEGRRHDIDNALA